jgi:hypothetical protein
MWFRAILNFLGLLEMSLIALGRPLKILMHWIWNPPSDTWPELPETSVNNLSGINAMIYTIWNQITPIINNEQ